MICDSRLFSLIGVLVLTLNSLAAQAQAGVTDELVSIGMSAPFSGAGARFGSALKEGAEIYLRHVNASGGIHGRKIRLLTLDDADVPARTVENSRKMIKDDGVLALLSYYGTATTEAVLPLLNQTETPLIGVASGAESLRVPLQRYLFNLRASYLDEADAIVTQLDAQGLNQIAVFYQNDSVGRSALSGARTAMARLALTPSAIAGVEPGAPNIAKAAADIAKGNPQAVVVIAPAKAAVEFVHAMQNRGAYPQFIGLSVLADEPLIKQIGIKGRGLGVSQVIPNPVSMSLPLTRQYLSLLKQNRGAVASYYGLEGFIAAKLTVEAIRRAGKNPTRQKIVAALESEFDLGDYFISFAPNSRSGSRFVEMSVIGSNGRIVR